MQKVKITKQPQPKVLDTLEENIAAFRQLVARQLNKSGLRHTEVCMEYLKGQSDAKLAYGLDKDIAVSIYKRAIEDYKNHLTIAKYLKNG